MCLLTNPMHREHLAMLLTEARLYNIAQGIRHLICQCDMRKGTVQGYRIQIYSENSSRSDMEELRKKCEEFNEFFPDIPVYLEYYDPDFKIRAGNFETKLASIPSLKRIRTRYPSAYSIKTDIKMDIFLRPKEIRDSTESTNFYDNSTTAGQ